MSLKTQIVNDTAIYLNVNEFAEPVIFTPSGGEAVSINMVINREAELDDDELGGAMSAGALGYIGMADVAAVNPYGDVINSTHPNGTAETWTVRRIKSAEHGMYEVVLVRDVRIT